MKKAIKKDAGILILIAMTRLVACAGEPADDESSDTGTGTGAADTESVEIAPENMIDDLEDGDDAIIGTTERSGDWYAFNDGSAAGQQSPDPNGDFSPEAGGPEGSAFAVHSTGSGFTVWGAGVGFDINGADPEGTDIEKGVFDASAFEGLVFSAKGSTSIRAMLAIKGVISAAEGGSCISGGGDGGVGECDNAHGLDVDLTDTWKQYKLPFSEIAQEEGWGQTMPFDATSIASILFQVGPGVDFDIWIDEVGFY